MEKLYSGGNPFVGYIHNKRLDSVIKLIPRKEGIKILDAGCGEGQLLGKIAELMSAKLYGVDVTAVAIESAKKRFKEAKFSLGDITNLPYKNNLFDVVICTEVIEHIRKYKEAIKELKRVVKEGGLLIITFPNEPICIFSRLIFLRKPRIEDHVNSFSPSKMKKEVNLRMKRKVNLPLNMPDLISLIHIMAFEK